MNEWMNVTSFSDFLVRTMQYFHTQPTSTTYLFCFRWCPIPNSWWNSWNFCIWNTKTIVYLTWNVCSASLEPYRMLPLVHNTSLFWWHYPPWRHATIFKSHKVQSSRMTPHNLPDTHQHFSKTCCLHLQDRIWFLSAWASEVFIPNC